MKPSWLWRDGFVHLNYELPHRIHATQLYPIRAPNGSSIILCGHDHGLTVIWRGGKPFKNTSNTRRLVKSTTAKKNGFEEGLVMMIDSDEEHPSNLTHNNNISIADDGFVSEEEEYDPAEPYDQVLDVLDVPDLQTGILHLAVPSMMSNANKSTFEPTPPLLAKTIVVAAVCTDSSIRLFTIPLVPQQYQKQSVGVSLVVQRVVTEASSQSTNFPRGISMTWTAEESTTPQAEDDRLEWSLLIASHSAAVGGALSISQHTLSEDGLQLSKSSPVVLQTEHLHNLATSISFSTSQYPSRRHTQLLVVDMRGAVRLYDPLAHRRLQYIRARDRQHTSQPRSAWLTSIYPPFADGSDVLYRFSGISDRNRILDCRWAFDGKCIIALLSDGQWGLWDIEGIGPAQTKSSPDGTGDKIGGGMSPGNITQFALRGFVGDGAASKSASVALDSSAGVSDRPVKESVKLAPMTPKTRKIKQRNLFSNPSECSLLTPASVRGGISLLSIADTTTSNAPDESLVLWYGSAVFAIPSLMTYWQRIAGSSSKGNNIGALLGPSMAQLTGLSTMGEMITSVTQAPLSSTASSRSKTLHQKMHHDVLMAAEHRLVMMCQPISRGGALASDDHDRTGALSDEVNEQDLIRLDQSLLSKQQLDLGGLDRMLDGIEKKSSDNTGNSLFGFGRTESSFAARARKVGFAAGI